MEVKCEKKAERSVQLGEYVVKNIFLLKLSIPVINIVQTNYLLLSKPVLHILKKVHDIFH